MENLAPNCDCKSCQSAFQKRWCQALTGMGPRPGLLQRLRSIEKRNPKPISLIGSVNNGRSDFNRRSDWDTKGKNWSICWSIPSDSLLCVWKQPNNYPHTMTNRKRRRSWTINDGARSRSAELTGLSRVPAGDAMEPLKLIIVRQTKTPISNGVSVRRRKWGAKRRKVD